MSDLVLLNYYLGIEVRQRPRSITLCQSAYAEKLLDKAGLGSCNPTLAPMEPHLKVSKESMSSPVDAPFYRSIIGSLCYLVHTRPDITFAVEYLSQFMDAPAVEHLNAIKHMLRYIAGTRSYRCSYLKHYGAIELVGYSSSDMAKDVDDRKSTTGVLFMLGNSPVSWKSQKQKIVALSSCEAEYVAATTTAYQGVWLGCLIGDLLHRKPDNNIIHVDNKFAIQLCKNPVFHD
ncbi:secreted RxLR effector protein 161-like [Phragmites australis]|uniref:secreted RxLR effector protein 161-like n=1 Tax=Phragmites australis TaxID=29695 RepID=UPI002D793A03|nr:secreted RxLR effector protein 161-like [Phragmites australis]